MRAKSLLVPMLVGALALGAGPSVAQIDGTRGVAPVDSSGAFEIGGIAVDVAGKTAEAARLGGWRLAQRKAWVQLSRRMGGGGGLVSDGTLDAIVSGIVVENEQIGPNRYIARLGVLFDRGRASGLLGISAYAGRSPPMLVLPVMWSGGTGQVFEQRTEWQAAWARFRTGNSAIDYVRPSGTGPDSLLLNVGQTERPGRGWWRTIIDQYGANEILIPVVRLYRQWPGGPVVGVFQARHGADGELLGTVTLRVGSSQGLAQLLDTGVQRLDAMYQEALRQGMLDPDPTLSPPPEPTPEVTDEEDTAGPDEIGTIIDGLGPVAGAGIAITLQYDSPQASSVPNVEGAIRSIPGVRSATTTSLALGGVSLMRVTFDGDPATLRTALEARGYQVLGSGQTLRIRRAATLVPSDLPADDATAG